MLKDYLERGFAHARWADERLLEAMAAPQTPAKALGLMAHYLSTFHIWYDRIQLGAIRAPVWPEPVGFDFAVNLRLSYTQMGEILEDFGPNYDLSFSYQTTQGDTFSNTVADTLQHALLHGHYHRGQINALLRQAGITPAVIDYIVYVRS